jgi:hypothetical protein
MGGELSYVLVFFVEILVLGNTAIVGFLAVLEHFTESLHVDGCLLSLLSMRCLGLDGLLDNGIFWHGFAMFFFIYLSCFIYYC